MKTRQELELLFEECENTLRENKRTRKEFNKTIKNVPFKKAFYASSYYRSVECQTLYREWKREVTRLNKLRQALWHYSIYKQLNY